MDNKYYVFSERDKIDAEVFDSTWKEAVQELLVLNSYEDITDTDWTIATDIQVLVSDGCDL